MRTISTEKMKNYILFFETLRLRCEANESANARKLGTYLKITPGLFYAAAALGYFKKINKSCYQCSITQFTSEHVIRSLKKSSEQGKEWQNKRVGKGKVMKEFTITPVPVKDSEQNSMPPVFADIKAFAEMRAAKGNKKIDPLLFHAHYSAIGWKIGKNPIKNWKAAFVTWERRDIRADPMAVNLCSKETFEEEMKRRGYCLKDINPTNKEAIANYIKSGLVTKEIIDLFTIQDLLAALKRKGVTGEIHYTTTLTEKL